MQEEKLWSKVEVLEKKLGGAHQSSNYIIKEVKFDNDKLKMDLGRPMKL